MTNFKLSSIVIFSSEKQTRPSFQYAYNTLIISQILIHTHVFQLFIPQMFRKPHFTLTRQILQVARTVLSNILGVFLFICTVTWKFNKTYTNDSDFVCQTGHVGIIFHLEILRRVWSYLNSKQLPVEVCQNFIHLEQWAAEQQP